MGDRVLSGRVSGSIVSPSGDSIFIPVGRTRVLTCDDLHGWWEGEERWGWKGKGKGERVKMEREGRKWMWERMKASY